MSSPVLAFLAWLLFGSTYVLLNWPGRRRLPVDRATIALSAAAFGLLLGLSSVEQALSFIDGKTLVLLLAMMGIASFVRAEGWLEKIEQRFIPDDLSQTTLLAYFVFGVGALSALLTNDAVCVFGSAIVLSWHQRRGVAPLPFFLALATAANTGSAATLFGNPQNMLCASLGKLDFTRHFLLSAPLSLALLGVNYGLIAWLFRKELKAPLSERHASSQLPVGSTPSLLALMATFVLALFGVDLTVAALGAYALLLLAKRASFSLHAREIDWSLLVFFGGLFVVMGQFGQAALPKSLISEQLTPLLARARESYPAALLYSGVTVLLSNLVSNVPLILLLEPFLQGLQDPHFHWEFLSLVSTFAGNATPIGSVANLIVIQSAASTCHIGFWSYTRVGLPLTLVSVASAALWLTYWL